jgi:hypothetical protein
MEAISSEFLVRRQMEHRLQSSVSARFVPCNLGLRSAARHIHPQETASPCVDIRNITEAESSAPEGLPKPSCASHAGRLRGAKPFAGD